MNYVKSTTNSTADFLRSPCGQQEGLKIDYDDATYEESVKVAGKMKDMILKSRVLRCLES